MSGFTHASLDILTELEANNNKEWYDANKGRFQKLARDPFEAMLGVVTALLDGSRNEMRGSAKTMFRQYRDVRFSKDKTRYKSTVSGMLTPSGIKGEGRGVVYAQIGPAGGWIAAGFHQMETADLGLVRDKIIAEADRFTEIRDRLESKGWALGNTNSLSSMPRGFAAQAEHPLADVIRMKGYTVSAQTPPEVWISGDIVERLVALAEDTGPMMSFIREALTKKS